MDVEKLENNETEKIGEVTPTPVVREKAGEALVVCDGRYFVKI